MSVCVPMVMRRTASVPPVEMKPSTARLIGQGDTGLIGYCTRILDMLRLCPVGVTRGTLERIGEKSEVGRALRVLRLADAAWCLNVGSYGVGLWTESEVWFHGPDPDEIITLVRVGPVGPNQ